jgi:O-antigen/teichoic acid export membrane protein
MRNQLIVSGLGVVALKVAGTILSFGLSIILARSLGASEYGVYSLGIAILMVASIPIQSGIPILVVREVAKAKAHQDLYLIKLVRSWCNRLIIGYFVILCVATVAIISLTDQWNGSHRANVTLAGIASIPFLALILMQSAIMRGIGRVVFAAAPDGLIRPLINLTLFVSIGYFIAEGGLTAIQAMLIYLATIIATFLLTRQMLVRSAAEALSVTTTALSLNIYGKWRETLYSLTFVGGIQLLFGYLDILILGIFLGDTEIGIYRVAVQISILVSFSLTVLNQMLYPHFASLYTKGELKGLQRLVANSSLIILILAAIPAMPLIFMGGNFLEIIYGDEYVIGTIALKILVIGQLVNAAFGSVGAILNMTGHEKDAVIGMSIAIVVNVALNFILIPVYGINGAAFSSALAFFIWNSILRQYVKKRLDIESSGIAYYVKNKFFMVSGGKL